jgi:hypothetical protein
MITKFGDLMIIATPYPHRHHRDPAVPGQSCLLRTPSTDYAKALTRWQTRNQAHKTEILELACSEESSSIQVKATTPR